MQRLLNNIKLYWVGAAVLWVAFAGIELRAQNTNPARRLFGNTPGYWVENTLQKMTLEEKIGQLIMVPAFSYGERYNRKMVEKLIARYKIGGLIFMQGNAIRQGYLSNHFQKISDLPLLISTDAEWGLSMRLDSTIKFPKNMTLGAIENDSLLYEYGRELARQCRAIGVHINFAPVVDVNNNAANPVINDRSFGEDKRRVARAGVQVMKGMQDEGVMACAKHFPGHGDTDADSHYTLPLIPYSRARLDSLELYPFAKLIDAGVQSVMMAHLYIPSLDAERLPSTLSPKIVKRLLRDSLHFNGLIFTDALNMNAVTRAYPPGKLELAAIKAGNDVLLFTENVPAAVAAIKQAVIDSQLSIEEIDARVTKILLAKEWLNLHQERMVDPKKASDVLFSRRAYRLRKKLHQESITIAKNQDNILPIKNLANKKIAFVQVGYEKPTPFFRTLDKYADVEYFHLPKITTNFYLDSLSIELRTYDAVIVGLFEMTRLGYKNYGVTPSTLNFLCNLNAANIPTIAVLFGNPYSLQYFQDEAAIVVAYDEAPDAQIAAAEIIFGGRKSKGKLPVLRSRFGNQPYTPLPVPRLAFDTPESVGMDGPTLAKIDSIAGLYIYRKATPGCAVLVARGNTIVYEKGFGKTEYGNGGVEIEPTETLWDLASVTKVMATTLCVMKLYEEGKISLDASISDYLPEVSGKLAQVKIRQLLEHTSGLPAWIPFWKALVVGGKLDTTMLSETPRGVFTHPLADNLYLNLVFADSVWAQIARHPVKERAGMVYSDLNFIILGKIVEKISKRSLEQYAALNFYEPLGMSRTLFNPAEKCVTMIVPPTAEDRNFRMAKIQGFVNDEASACLGGVAGHAGLFSTTYDLAKALLMLKNGGKYGDARLLKPETIKKFTSAPSQFLRRGLGWDKPDAEGRNTPTSRYASVQTFGHLGFTGTCVWVDPLNDLTFVFLANRTYPNPDDRLFVNESVRVKVMDVAYEAIRNFKNMARNERP